jgi:hypothetical protein
MAENDSIDKHSLLFMGLVTSFQQNALASLGKLVDPTTGKTEVNLPGAAAYIDLLDMLSAKTSGNLSADETSTVEQILSHLKLNYVEELNKPKPETNEKTTSDAPPDAEPEGTAPPEESNDKAES